MSETFTNQASIDVLLTRYNKLKNYFLAPSGTFSCGGSQLFKISIMGLVMDVVYHGHYSLLCMQFHVTL